MRKILILSGANGVYNLGDDAMFEVVASHFHKNDWFVYSDGKSNWRSQYVNQLLPFLHKSIGKGWLSDLFWIFNLLRYFLTEHLENPLISMLINIDPWLAKYRKVISECDIILFAGQGSMNDKYASHSILGRGMIVNLAASYGKNIIISGNGVGPINNEFNIKVAKRYINKIKKIFIRDKNGSHKQLIKLNYPAERIVAQIDDAFYLKKSEDNSKKAKKLLKDLGISSNFLIINIHLWDTHLIDQLFLGICNSLKKHTDIDILLAPNYYSHEMDDRVLLRKLKFFLEARGLENVYILEQQLSASEMKSVVSLSEIMIATRYHMGVFALSEGIPAILITLDGDYYIQKMTGLLNWYGMEKYTIPVSDLNKLDDLIKSLRKNRKKYKEKITTVNLENKKKGMKSLKFISSIVRNQK